jgi:hypothetical protein
MVGFASHGLRIEYLMIGGGGGGQSGIAGQGDAGAGAGGEVLVGSIILLRRTVCSVTIGAAGAGGVQQGTVGGNGGNTIVSNIGQARGALGGGYNLVGVQTYGWGSPSPKGAGGGAPGQGAGSDGIQGHAGGAGASAGGSSTGNIQGPGIFNDFTGQNIQYGQGGLSGKLPTTADNIPGRGGNGGRGGAFSTNWTQGFIGQAGLFVARYLGTSAKANGGFISIVNGYVVHSFDGAGTFTVL